MVDGYLVNKLAEFGSTDAVSLLKSVELTSPIPLKSDC
jgi:hypothetical protein